MFATLSSYGKMGTYNSGVLDLSRPTHHRDSIETRRTPSPSNASSFSSEGSPTSHNAYLTKNPRDFRTNANQPRFSPKSPSTYVSDRFEPTPSPLAKPSTPTSPQSSAMNYPPLSALNSLISNQIKQRLTPSPSSGQYSPCHPVQDNHHAAHEKHFFMHSNNHESNLPPISEISENYISTSTTTASSTPIYPMVIGRDGKLSRPFKAYPHDPLSIAASFTATDTLLDTTSTEKYNNFRKRMLEQIHAANGGHATVSNPKMRRTPSKSISSEDSPHYNNNNNNIINNNNSNGSVTSNDGLSLNGMKDSAYFERRKKNNAAAKKSRDRRRIKEDEIAIRAAFLERENIELKFELAAARKQLALYGVTALS